MDFLYFWGFHAFTFILINLAGWLGWLAAGCWLDGEEEGFQGLPTRSTLWRGRRISKDLVGWLAAGCWLDGEEEGFKDVPHARRSGEVGGFCSMSARDFREGFKLTRLLVCAYFDGAPRRTLQVPNSRDLVGCFL